MIVEGIVVGNRIKKNKEDITGLHFLGLQDISIKKQFKRQEKLNFIILTEKGKNKTSKIISLKKIWRQEL